MKQRERYHFIGIGGIGMSALAQILLEKKAKVYGSDLAAHEMVKKLKKAGAKIQIGHCEENLSQSSCVVYTSAVKEDNPEFAKAKRLGLPMLHRSELLDRLMQGQKALLITGTHGKTTTTSLLATVLLESKRDPSFVVGGIINSLQTNGRLGSGDCFVAEADESDGSFLRSKSFGAIVTNLEREHMDYWKDEKRLNDAFQSFFDQVESKEHLFWCCDDPALASLFPKGVSYGFSQKADLRIENFSQNDFSIRFTLLFENRRFENITLPLTGRHNALNAAAVFGLSLRLGLSEEEIRLAFLKFSGVHRRLQHKGSKHRVDFFDDYGHHPTEIKATLSALRDAVKERRMVVLYQPHRYSRTKDLFFQFGSIFDEADQLFLTDIYAAHEKPIEGIDAPSLVGQIQKSSSLSIQYLPKERIKEIASFLRPHDVFLTIGAGDVTQMGGDIYKSFARKRVQRWKVALLCGGNSSEHEISLLSAKNIAKGLDPAIYDVKIFGCTKKGGWILGEDVIERLQRKEELLEKEPRLSKKILLELSSCEVAIPVFHGPRGEDGMMGGFLETLGLPYVGCNYMAGALCMHKGWLKHLALSKKIPTAPFLDVSLLDWKRKREEILSEILQSGLVPVYVKPCRLGSSIGISRATDKESLAKAMDFAFLHDSDLIVEKEVIGEQIEFSIRGSDWLDMGDVAQIRSKGEFYSYEKKYSPGSLTKIPPDLSQAKIQEGRELALQMYRISGCQGLARVDFFLSTDGNYYMNEINPFPGFTDFSAYPLAWKSRGVDATLLMQELIVSAFYSKRQKSRLLG
jgi:UDP-N-acetylmuramate--alanine ligase